MNAVTSPAVFAERTVCAPMIRREAAVTPSSWQDEDRSVELMMSTGAAVLRFDWYDGEYYEEVLSLEDGHVRLERMNDYAPLLDTHSSWDLGSVIGSVIPGTVRVENGQMLGRVQLSSAASCADIVTNIREGHIQKVSIGYQVFRFEEDVPEAGKRKTMRATDWEPIEVSFVPLPAEFAAGVRSAPASAPQTRGHQTPQGGVPCTIRGAAAAPHQEHHMDPNNQGGGADAPANTTTEAASAASTPNANAPETLTEEQRSALTIPRIRQVVERAGLSAQTALDIIGRHSENPMSEGQLTDAIAGALEASRARPPLQASVGNSQQSDAAYCRAVEAAVLLRADPSITIEDERARADAADFRGMSLMEMGRGFLERSGISTRGMGRLELAGAVLGLRQGQMTTSDFANALSSAVSKRVRTAYEAAPQTWRPFVSAGTLPDFKPTNIIGLGDAPQLLLVRENAEFTYGAMADTGMTYQLSTYGRIIAVTRQAIINDDKSLFSRIPAAFGRKAADLESDLVYGTLTGNPTMADGLSLFHASHGNLAAAGGAISVATVAAGEQAMMQQTSAEGGFINVRPAYLIVGPAKKVEAQQFLTAVSATQTSNVNPYPGTLQLIVDPRITGNQWFLAADPAAFDTIEVAHLEGQEALYLETQPGFDVDGVKTKARLDVGAAPIDHRGLYRNPGN